MFLLDRAKAVFASVPAVVTVLSAILTGSAQGADRQAFEIVKGWEVERTVGNTGPNACLMSHTYKDKDDDNAVNGIIFALNGSEAVLVLVYEKWQWDKNEKVVAPFFLDKNRYAAKSAWTGDAETLTGAFPDSIVPNLMAAKTIVLHFDNGKADFRIENFAEGYESLRRCNATKVAAPTVAAPQTPVAPVPAAPAPPPGGAYGVIPIGSGADFVGCMVQNETLGLGLVAVGQNLALIANTSKFPFGKGVDITGTWAVDGGAAMPFTSKSETAHTVTIDVPNTREVVTNLISGRIVSIRANGTEVPFVLGPMKQAFSDLSTCMETKKAP